MANTDVFNRFDMVVSVTEKTLNDQLTHLLRMGVVHPELIIVQKMIPDSKGNIEFKYEIYDNDDLIPRSKEADPMWATLCASIHPQVTISESGDKITFLLKFRSGRAWFWAGMGPVASLREYDVTNWCYALSVNLDLARFDQSNPAAKVKAPGFVMDQLNKFVDNMFDVRHLFLNFEAISLTDFDPAHTTVNDMGELIKEQFILFMKFYLTDLLKEGNPFVLGYSIVHGNDPTPGATDVPDSLKPAGTTYTMYHDPVNQQLSTLNFVLATKGGHKAIAGRPDVFSANWIADTEQCEAKLIYSSAVLLDELIMKPLFNKLCSEVYGKIKDHVSVTGCYPYEIGKGITSWGFDFTICDQNENNDKYVNHYTVAVVNDVGKVKLDFNGHLYFYKHVEKNMGCTAAASASVMIDWSALFTIGTSKDKDGNPILTLDHNFEIGNVGSINERNTCADIWSHFGDLLKFYADLLSLFQSDYLGNLFKNALTVDVPQLGNLTDLFSKLHSSVNNVVMLPAGGVFFFKNPHIDNLGNLSLELNYKTDNNVEEEVKAYAAKLQAARKPVPVPVDTNRPAAERVPSAHR